MPNIALRIKNGKIIADERSKSIVMASQFGRRELGDIVLDISEAMFLMEFRNATLFDETGRVVTLNELVDRFYSENIFVRYSVFKDWRLRGLYGKCYTNFRMEQKFNKSPIKEYPSGELDLDASDLEVLFLPDELFSITYNPNAKRYYSNYWIGQWGLYKKSDLGFGLKLDVFETLLVAKHGAKIKDAASKKYLDFDELMEIVKHKIPFIHALFNVYEDWRSRGYVVKTGFKFGTHFRIYFPGVLPDRKDNSWQHSKHVIHVFPKDASMIMSEWARAVRVAHSVRKTFIMAVPEMGKNDYLKERTEIDYVFWYRNENNITEKPNINDPSFMVIAMHEDEKLSGKILASALERADKHGLRLLIAIVDRESSVTYYVANRIDLPGSENKYYEIVWLNP
ncbi:MAG: tRNA-intron lyase [Candidatus Aenigmarchaeota archaeon]|nr:tRNA-intron lyase [Candidatus Aenigmarchaeota archaeon]